MEAEKNRSGAAIKAALLIVFIIATVVVARFTPAKEFLTPEALSHLIERAGIWAPVAYIFMYAAGVCLFLPGTLLATIGAAVFGPYFGFVYVWLGAITGASAAFFIGRYLGREFAASLIGDRLKKYDEAVERKGFATVLYLRLVYFPSKIDRVIRLFVVTPDMHQVHHSVIIRETNSNFGFNLPWWDRLLGTYRAQPSKGHEGMTIGLSHLQDPKRLTLFRLLLMPLVEEPGAVAINRH